MHVVHVWLDNTNPSDLHDKSVCHACLPTKPISQYPSSSCILGVCHHLCWSPLQQTHNTSLKRADISRVPGSFWAAYFGSSAQGRATCLKQGLCSSPGWWPQLCDSWVTTRSGSATLAAQKCSWKLPCSCFYKPSECPRCLHTAFDLACAIFDTIDTKCLESWQWLSLAFVAW